MKADREFELVSAAEFPWVCIPRSLGPTLAPAPSSAQSPQRESTADLGFFLGGVETRARGCSLAFCFNIVQSLLKSFKLKV